MRQHRSIAGMTPGVQGLMIVTIAIFLAQALLDGLTGGLITRLLGLSLSGLRKLYVWQFVTYLFVHGSLGHIFLNMLGLYFLGPETERAMGTRHFLSLYFVSGVLGGLGWLIMSEHPWAICIGASGSLFGIIAAFAALFPQRQVTLLVFFVLPITMRAWVMAVGLGLIELFYLLSPFSGGIAYAAHLAGGVAGYVYTLALTGKLAGWKDRIGRRASAEGGDDDAHAGEIDRLLDKISSQGIHSLTPREREFLERASRGRSSKQ